MIQNNPGPAQGLPKADLIGVLVNPNEPASGSQIRDAETAAREAGQRVIVLKAASESEIEAAFAAIVQQGAGGLLLGANPTSPERTNSSR
jgi:putative tryptophan/tyrosine transport system substrate-binding protein